MENYRNKLHPFCQGCIFAAILPNLEGENVTFCNSEYHRYGNYWDNVSLSIKQFGEFTCSNKKTRY